MPSFDECLILLPCSTLEDFPRDAAPADARNLLAAWTVLWHPHLIAATGQNPAWYRADSPPEPRNRQLIVVPTLSQAKLPEAYEMRFRATDDSVWLDGSSRDEMLAALQLTSSAAGVGSMPLVHQGRSIGPDDFFAFGFGMLQVQVMTRRMRYTSNLDEIYVQKRVVAAAEAFIAGDAQQAIDSLHEAFDSLAEERDHYFSSDPALVDLTLLTPATLPRVFADPEFSTPLAPAAASEMPTDQAVTTTDETVTTTESPAGQLATPVNVLADAEVIAALEQQRADANVERLLAKLRSGEIGWAGGGPAADVVMDTLTYRECLKQLESAHASAKATVGVAPPVYARLAGSTPADLTRTLVALGYVGMTPIDFTGGTGFAEEPKVLRREGGAEIEALTARPIDANNDASFLAFAPRLGEMIDAGEVATGLLVHWPGAVCDSYRDLRRLASWSLALGRFHTLASYFTDGEHPYHHNNGGSQSPEASQRLVDAVSAHQPDPLSRIVLATRQSVHEFRNELLQGMTALARGQTLASDTPTVDLARALGASPIDSAAVTPAAEAVMVMNPYAAAQRLNVRVAGPVIDEKHIYAVSREHGATVVTLDVPAAGFARVHAAAGASDSRATASSPSWLSSLLRTGPKRIADNDSLRNEFMEAMIDTKTGGIQGVYSGPVRGNRFSLRLVVGDRETTSRCDRIRVLQSEPSTGQVETSGTLLDANQNSLATFTLVFSLDRGSRLLGVTGELRPTPALALQPQPWTSYVAVRVAVSTDTGTTRAILRDKLHRTSGRRLVAPLGVVIEETERQTLIAADGLAYHRRVDDRFIDTLVLVSGETSCKFNVHYGFDVVQPVEIAKSLVAPPLVQPIANPLATGTPASLPASSSTSSSSPAPASAGQPTHGWLLHTSPKDVSVISLTSHVRSDAQLALVLRVVRTRSMGGNSTLRFCRSVALATVWTPELANAELGWDLPLEAPVAETNESSETSPPAAFSNTADRRYSLSFAEDAVKMTLSGHQVLELLVVLA